MLRNNHNVIELQNSIARMVESLKPGDQKSMALITESTAFFYQCLRNLPVEGQQQDEHGAIIPWEETGYPMLRPLIQDVDFVVNGDGHINLTTGEPLERVKNPGFNTVVYTKDKDTLQPIIVISGQLWSGGRMSNFWYWYDINENGTVSTTKRHGYGDFFKFPFDHKVNIQYSVEPLGK